ncbi:MAG: hypothetical protein JWP35_3007 [Caulobacter sp.]|nr:hypothetical protein [Caulobacter sp.]
MRIEWHFNANADLQHALAYVARESPTAAHGIYDDIGRALRGWASIREWGVWVD